GTLPPGSRLPRTSHVREVIPPTVVFDGTQAARLGWYGAPSHLETGTTLARHAWHASCLGTQLA
ncbi:MAG: hypothetical protein ACREBG_15760, partial [Pyrinomonadaceae bacterium]